MQIHGSPATQTSGQQRLAAARLPALERGRGSLQGPSKPRARPAPTAARSPAPNRAGRRGRDTTPLDQAGAWPGRGSATRSGSLCRAAGRAPPPRMRGEARGRPCVHPSAGHLRRPLERRCGLGPRNPADHTVHLHIFVAPLGRFLPARTQDLGGQAARSPSRPASVSVGKRAHMKYSFTWRPRPLAVGGGDVLSASSSVTLLLITLCVAARTGHRGEPNGSPEPAGPVRSRLSSSGTSVM